MRRHLNELRNDVHLKDEEIQDMLKKLGNEERERGIVERKDKSRLQKEMEILEKNYIELE